MELLSKKWILILTNAILIIGFGLILILVPTATLNSLVFVIGIVIAFVGLVLIFGAFNYAKENKNMIFWLFQGLFNLVLGGVVMFFPEASIKFLMILAGLWTIVLGVYQFSVSLGNSELKGNFLHKTNGVVAILIGFILIFFPELILGIMVQVFGFLLLLIGGGMLYLTILLKGFSKVENLNDVDEEETLNEEDDTEEETIP